MLTAALWICRRRRKVDLMIGTDRGRLAIGTVTLSALAYFRSEMNLFTVRHWRRSIPPNLESHPGVPRCQGIIEMSSQKNVATEVKVAAPLMNSIGTSIPSYCCWKSEEFLILKDAVREAGRSSLIQAGWP